MFRLFGVVLYSVGFVPLFFLVLVESSFFSWLLFFSMVFFLFGVFEIFEFFGITRKLSFKSLGNEKFLVIGGTFPAFLSSYYTLLHENLNLWIKGIVVLLGGVVVFLVFFLFFLFTFKGRRSKLRIGVFLFLSLVLASFLVFLLGRNVFLLFSVITLMLLLGFLVVSFSKFSVWNIDKFFVFVFVILVGVSDLGFVVMRGSGVIVYGVLISSVMLVLGVFSVLLRKFSIMMMFGILWGGIIALFTFLFKSDLPAYLLHMNILSEIVIMVFLFLYWYLDKYRFSFDLLIRDVDSFLKKLREVAPVEIVNYSEFVTRIFNSHSRFIKISIFPQNFLPNFVLLKMLKKKSLSISEILDGDSETKDFFVSNGIVWISRISNEVSETDYLVVKIPMLVGNRYFQEMLEEMIRNLLPIFLEIEKMVSNVLVYPLRQEIEKKREHQVREIEAFDKVRYFLIKPADMFLYEDKVIAYKYVEDVERVRGYYFDFVVKQDSFLGFLFFIPDRLFLSNFVLLAIKGIVKSYSPEDISFEKLREVSKSFIEERDLPLKINVSGLSIVKDGIIVYPSDSTFLYVLEEGVWKEIKESQKIGRDSVLIISNRSVDETTFSLVSKIPKENKFNFIKECFEKIEVQKDTFLLVCI